jgi:hypothetical protein
MNQKKFNLIIENLQMMRPLPEQEVKYCRDCFDVFKYIFSHDYATKKDMKQFSLEQLEWSMDALRDGVITDYYVENNDLSGFRGNPCYELIRAQDLMTGIAQLPRVKKAEFI